MRKGRSACEYWDAAVHMCRRQTTKLPPQRPTTKWTYNVLTLEFELGLRIGTVCIWTNGGDTPAYCGLRALTHAFVVVNVACGCETI